MKIRIVLYFAVVLLTSNLIGCTNKPLSNEQTITTADDNMEVDTKVFHGE